MRVQHSGLGPGPSGRYDARKLKPGYQQDAYRQAMAEASPLGTGHYAGLHPENRPYMSEDLQPISRKGQSQVALANDDLEEDDRYYSTRPPTSARRYTSIAPAAPPPVRQVIHQGGKIFVVHEEVDPRSLRAPIQRASRSHPQLPPPRSRYVDEEEEEEQYQQPQARYQRHWHPLVWIGLTMIVLIAGWMLISMVSNWWQNTQADWAYGKQRHFEINAVIGHNDSQTNPSHFTAENNNGTIFVIEQPGGDISKGTTYQITAIPGNQGNPPVQIAFQDVNGDSKLDMVVEVGYPGQQISVILLNNGTKFVSHL